jgi:hypothetical protein
MRLMPLLVIGFFVAAVFQLVRFSGQADGLPLPPPVNSEHAEIDAGVDRVNSWFRDQWKSRNIVPAASADDLTVFRRLHLALLGTIPSLQDIRVFEADTEGNRIERWVDRLLKDPRYASYMAQRIARSLVGTEDGPFLIFRRDRLVAWLESQLQHDEPWSQISQELISADGLWTDRPATNFITSARIDEDEIDENKLAGRVARVFLGQRIDCAQCHDHPFDPRWKQSDFEGLAAFFCQATVSLAGVKDRRKDDQGQDIVYRVVDPGKTDSDARVVKPVVPFNSEWLSSHDGLRLCLSNWVTHRDNQRFGRAAANRIWGLMFGKPYIVPVDDVPHPSDESIDPLDILGNEFRKNGDRLSTLIRMIARSEVFRLSSEETAGTPDEFTVLQDSWAVFPLTRLRPEQVIGSLFQAAHIRTINHQSHLFIRIQKYGNENDFIREYGDPGDDELLPQPGTIPQALLQMNGRFTNELSKAEFLSAAGQLAAFCTDDSDLIECCFLSCLGRRPLTEEHRPFMELLREGGLKADDSGGSVNPRSQETSKSAGREGRRAATQDIFWALFNSPEFTWNH